MKNLIYAFASLLFMVSCSQGTAQENMTVSELNKVEFNKDNDKVVLDVRTPEEYAEGNIEGSQNIDFLKTDYFTSSIEGLDKNKTYYVICRSGGRSARASDQMRAAGFKNVVNVTGGMLAWQAANLPVKK
ncbi:rhodanese-like domain-containing protein [Marivirga arenosa]|uniref:Rhodanese-like domain-containing protein n=1 Tax=Marivirga arenosa TaxID=3059076 RepID=A0AA49JDL8_9BACT|nr:rhodanese-like domain-containing protein [Marivirga sp. ABR2-2]WKK84106.1 rhodanese-like domain-containing protein [Marivirga sp. ABR2-2]